MHSVFFVLLLMSGVLFWVGIIYPKALIPIVRFKLTRLTAAILFSLTGTCLLVGYACTSSDRDSEDVEARAHVLSKHTVDVDAVAKLATETKGSVEAGLGVSEDSLIKLMKIIDAGLVFSDNLDSDTTSGISEDGAVTILGPRDNPKEILTFGLVRGDEEADSRMLYFVTAITLFLDTSAMKWTTEFWERAPTDSTFKDSVCLGGRKYKLCSAMGAPVPNVTLGITADVTKKGE